MESKSRSSTQAGLLCLAISVSAVAGSTQSIPPVANQSGAANRAQSDVESLRRLEEDYLRAEMEDDAALAAAILADDYVGLRPDGSASGKADVLSRLARHERSREPYSVTATNMREYVFGDAACVRYTKVYSKAGSQRSYSENVLHVLTRRNGIWRLQLSSPLPALRP